MSFLMAISAMASMSAMDNTPPVGFAGELITIKRVLGVTRLRILRRRNQVVLHADLARTAVAPEKLMTDS